MKYKEFYEKLDIEIAIVKTYVINNQWENEKSEFFECPKKNPMPNIKNTLGEIIAKPNNQSGIYFMVCKKDTVVNSVNKFNKGKSLSPMINADEDRTEIKKGEVLYIGECGNFSERFSAHLDDRIDSKTHGLHIYSAERIKIKPENFEIILFPLKQDFYPQSISNAQKKEIRSIIETKLRAEFIPRVGQ